MAGRRIIRVAFLFSGVIWLTGCAVFTAQGNDPYFAGFYRSDPSLGVTASILDREELISLRPPREASRESPAARTDSESANLDYTYQDWYRNRLQTESGIQFNLVYHLNGPYYYRDFRSRFWHGYQRRWHRLPWYASGWMFDDLWWDYMYWDYLTDWHPWGYDPWYGYYDPWYGYYDPWYYDPFWSYGYPYSNRGGYGWSSWHSWYGVPGYGTTRTKATEARPRNRGDLPTGVGPGLPSYPTLGNGMTKTIASPPGQSQTSGKTSATSGSSKQTDSGGSAASGRKARPRTRSGSYTRSKSSSSSSSGSSQATKSSSSGNKESKSSNSSRPRSRKP